MQQASLETVLPATTSRKCSAAADNCSANATCNTTGGFDCSQQRLPGRRRRSDINECENSDDCASIATCNNTAGGFTAAARRAPTSDGGRTRSDVNECLTGNGGCVGVAICNNTAGGSYCTCPSGYMLDGSGTSCVNVNECSTGAHSCNLNTTTCRDTPGGYECDCRDGFGNDVGLSCSNINECSLNTDDCHANATCSDRTPSASNGWKKWDCSCNPGYIDNNPGNAGRSCSDRNECSTFPCGFGTQCINGTWAEYPGRGYECVCATGYHDPGPADPYGVGCYPRCGDGVVRSGPGGPHPDANNEQCDTGTSVGVAPACENGPCSYCSSTCDSTSTYTNTAGCTDDSDNDADGDVDCEDRACSNRDGCANWACSQIDDYMTREGVKAGNLSGNDYGFQRQYTCGAYQCDPYDCNPYSCGSWWSPRTCYQTCYNTCYNTCFAPRGDDYTIAFSSDAQYRTVKVETVAPTAFDTVLYETGTRACAEAARATPQTTTAKRQPSDILRKRLDRSFAHGGGGKATPELRQGARQSTSTSTYKAARADTRPTAMAFASRRAGSVTASATTLTAE